jgi:hypothetical protein
MKTGFGYWLGCVIGMMVLAGLLCILFCSTGCNAERRNRQKSESVQVHDTVIRHESVSVRDTNSHSETRYVHDTAVGVAGRDIVESEVMGAGSDYLLHDTVIVQGPMRLVIRKGNIECREDSLTLVIAKLTTIIDSNSSSARLTMTDSVEARSVISEVRSLKVKWYQVWFEDVKSLLAIIGAVAVTAFSIRFIIKKSIV